MGWLYFHKPKGIKAIDAIKRSVGEDWWNKHVVAASATFEAVHAVIERYNPDSDYYVPDVDGMVRGIAVFKIGNRPKDEYNFGYKDMTESFGPYGCECAPSIIAAASPLKPLPDVLPEYSGLKAAHEYRARSLAKSKAKAAKRALKVGTKLKLAQPLSFGGVKLDEFTVERCRVRGRKGISTVFRSVVTGGLYSLSAMDLVEAKEVN